MGANMGKPAIEVDNVSMKCSLSREKVDSLKDVYKRQVYCIRLA